MKVWYIDKTHPKQNHAKFLVVDAGIQSTVGSVSCLVLRVELPDVDDGPAHHLSGPRQLRPGIFQRVFREVHQSYLTELDSFTGTMLTGFSKILDNPEYYKIIKDYTFKSFFPAFNLL